MQIAPSRLIAAFAALLVLIAALGSFSPGALAECLSHFGSPSDPLERDLLSSGEQPQSGQSSGPGSCSEACHAQTHMQGLTGTCVDAERDCGPGPLGLSAHSLPFPSDKPTLRPPRRPSAT